MDDHCTFRMSSASSKTTLKQNYSPCSFGDCLSLCTAISGAWERFSEMEWSYVPMHISWKSLVVFGKQTSQKKGGKKNIILSSKLLKSSVEVHCERSPSCGAVRMPCVEWQMSLWASVTAASRTGAETWFPCITKQVNSFPRQLGFNIKVNLSFLHGSLVICLNSAFKHSLSCCVKLIAVLYITESFLSICRADQQHFFLQYYKSVYNIYMVNVMWHNAEQVLEALEGMFFNQHHLGREAPSPQH